jgi:hypothetical protein
MEGSLSKNFIMRKWWIFSSKGRDYLAIRVKLCTWFHGTLMAQYILIHSSDLQVYLLRLDCTNAQLIHVEIAFAFIPVLKWLTMKNPFYSIDV